jgi:phage-related baseplate assembly protein
MLDARRMVTIEVTVAAPVYRPVPVSVVLYVYRDQDADSVRQRAQTALVEHFAFARQDFGQAVYTSDLIALLDGIAGVSHVALQAPAVDVPLGPRELATLGTVVLTVEAVR